jgi:septal ring factor EnvC (AmiA/AmiB activator)
MIRLNRTITTLTTAFLLSGSLALVSCSSSPDEEELSRLNELKEEYAALEKEATEKEQRRAALDKEIAEKNAKLKKCNDDQQVVKQRLGK